MGKREGRSAGESEVESVNFNFPFSLDSWTLGN